MAEEENEKKNSRFFDPSAITKMAYATVLAGSMYFGNPAQAQTTPPENKNPDNDKPKTEQKMREAPSDNRRWRMMHKADKLGDAKKEEINDRLRDKGRDNIDRIIKLGGETEYQKYLNTLQERINRENAEFGNPLVTKTIVYNPEMANAYMANGFYQEDATAEMIDRMKLREAPFSWTRSQVEGSLFASADNRPVTNPSVFGTNYADRPELALLVPLDENTHLVDGFTHEQNIDYVNLHEAWHCMDLWHMTDIPPDEIKQTDYTDMNVVYGSETAQKIFSMRWKQETLADVGAVGDMIANGNDIDVIEAVVRWREKMPELTHLSADALRELERRIEDMGIDKFRSLHDSHDGRLQLRSMYKEIVDNNTMTPEEMCMLAAYRTERQDVIDQIENDRGRYPSYLKVSKFAEYYSDLLVDYYTRNPDTGGKPKVLTPEELRVENAISDLSPEGELKRLSDRAYALSSKNGQLKGISPATMELAHDALQRELIEKMKEPGADLPVLQKRSEYLHTIYSGLDALCEKTNEKTGKPYFSYVDANAEHGIKPKKVEKFEM